MIVMFSSLDRPYKRKVRHLPLYGHRHTDISLHLTAVFASICGGRRSWKCWAMPFLVKSILPQSHCLALTRFHALPTGQSAGQQEWPGLPQPSLPHTTYSTVQKQSAMQEKHQLIPLARRQGGRESDKNSISKKWGLHGTTLAELELGVPCNLLGKRVRKKHWLVRYGTQTW